MISFARMGLSLRRGGAALAVPANTVAPTISGVAGGTLTLSRGTYSNSPTGYTQQWQNRSNTGAWANISGATATTYASATADGNNIRCLETATNAAGSSTPAPTAACTYRGNVSGPVRFPNGITATTIHTFNADCPVKAFEALSLITLSFANRYYNPATQAEVSNPDAVTLSASITYNGTTWQCLFGGAATGVMAAGAIEFTTDPVAVSIPAGAWYMVRTHGDGGTGYFCYQASVSSTNVTDAVHNGAMEYGAGLADKTMAGGTITPTVSGRNGAMFYPTAITQITTAPAILLQSDSKTWGRNDIHDSSGDFGELARGIAAAGLAYGNFGCHSDRLAAYLTSNAGRNYYKKYYSAVASALGINDMTNSSVTAATMLTNVAAFGAAFPGLPLAWGTVTPKTTGAWTLADGSDQTVTSGEAERVSFNNSIRATPASIATYFELADTVESSRNSGKWRADGTTGKYSGDGTHESPFGYLATAAADFHAATFAR